MRRKAVLLSALAASLLATWWAAGLEEAGDEAGEGTASPPAARPARRAEVRPAADLSALVLTPRLRAEGGADLFAVRSFRPPPPPAPPVTPMAPPLPFRHGGLLEDGGPLAVFLIEGERVHVLRAGDVLEGRYRVIAVSRARVDLVYLPLNQTQSLAGGAIP